MFVHLDKNVLTYILQFVSIAGKTSGKPEYSKVLWFEGKTVQDAFSDRVLAALDAFLARDGAA